MTTTTTRAQRLCAALAMGLVALTAGCGGDDEPDAASATTTTSTPAAGEAAAAVDTSSITVKGFRFDPKVVRVKAGQAVTWTNEEPDDDHAIHDTATGLKGPDFGPNAATKTFTHTYSRSGSFPYFCGIHNAMTGTIIVT